MKNKDSWNKLKSQLAISCRPLIDKDSLKPVELREAWIQQLTIVKEFFFKNNIKYPDLSPLGSLIDALERLKEGEDHEAFRRKCEKTTLSYKIDMATISAAIEYLSEDKRKVADKRKAAKEVLKLAEKYDFKMPRTHTISSRRKTDEADPVASITEWAKQCKFGRKGMAAKKSYFRSLEWLRQKHTDPAEDRLLTKEEVVELSFLLHYQFKG